MPRHDQTGPMGNGPRTGWGAGICTDDLQQHDRSREQIPGIGGGFRGSRGSRGFGGGRGRGRRARGNGFFNRPNSPNEKDILDSQKEALESRLNFVNQRLEKLGAQDSQES